MYDGSMGWKHPKPCIQFAKASFQHGKVGKRCKRHVAVLLVCAGRFLYLWCTDGTWWKCTNHQIIYMNHLWKQICARYSWSHLQDQDMVPNVSCMFMLCCCLFCAKAFASWSSEILWSASPAFCTLLKPQAGWFQTCDYTYILYVESSQHCPWIRCPVARPGMLYIAHMAVSEAVFNIAWKAAKRKRKTPYKANCCSGVHLGLGMSLLLVVAGCKQNCCKTWSHSQGCQF